MVEAEGDLADDVVQRRVVRGPQVDGPRVAVVPDLVLEQVRHRPHHDRDHDLPLPHPPHGVLRRSVCVEGGDGQGREPAGRGGAGPAQGPGGGERPAPPREPVREAIPGALRSDSRKRGGRWGNVHELRHIGRYSCGEARGERRKRGPLGRLEARGEGREGVVREWPIHLIDPRVRLHDPPVSSPSLRAASLTPSLGAPSRSVKLWRGRPAQLARY